MFNKLESIIEELGLREHFNKEKNIIKKKKAIRKNSTTKMKKTLEGIYSS